MVLHMITYILPLPETTNNAYRSSGRHWYKSEKAKAWEDTAGYLVSSAWDKKQFTDNVSVEIYIHVNRDRDIDGSLKPILDLFQRIGVYKNDKQVKKMMVEKSQDKLNPRVEVTIGDYKSFVL